jgi:hypothetical protein
VLFHLAQEELTDRELAAAIQGCEPWEGTRKLPEKELEATILGTHKN